MDRPKNSQARKKSSTSRKKKQNVPSSELEMVGEMLFGNIADISQTTTTATPAENKMINLGSKIAPEQMRDWNRTADSEEAAVTAPAHQMPVPVAGLTSLPVSELEIPGTPRGAKGSSFFNRQISMTYSLGFTALTLCIAIFLFQIFQAETPSEEEVATTDEITTFEKGEEVSPVLPDGIVGRFSTESQVAITAPMENFPHDSATIVVSEEDVIPQFDPTLAYESDIPRYASAEVHPAVGGNVSNFSTEQEAYPVFHAEAASVPPPSSPTYTASTGVDVWQNQATVSYQAGSTMDEIPIYQQPTAGVNNVAQYPTYAPTTPAVGNQATFSSPRKLAPPPVQPKNSTMNESMSAEDLYPSFDPGRGVEASIPVQYR